MIEENFKEFEQLMNSYTMASHHPIVTLLHSKD